MEYDVHGEAKVVVTVRVKANSEEEAIKKAKQKFKGLRPYMGNGGTDKLIGVEGDNESVDVVEEPVFDDCTID